MRVFSLRVAELILDVALRVRQANNVSDDFTYERKLITVSRDDPDGSANWDATP